MKREIRNSRVELVRILSMIIIIAHHYAGYGFNILKSTDITTSKYLVDILTLGGKVGVGCFVLITGYFMIDSKFTIKKLFKVLGEVWFYSIGSLILFLTILTPVIPITKSIIIKSIFPITFSLYWFMTCYVILMILSNYLNKFIKSLSKSEFKKLLIIMIIIWVIIPSLLRVDTYGSFLTNIIIFYFIAAYLKLHVSFNKKLILRNKIVVYLSGMILILSSVVFNSIGRYYQIYAFSKNNRYFASLNSILVLIISTSIFIYFLTKKPFYNKFINLISKCTLGIYLFHDNILFRSYLWKTIFKNEMYYNSRYLIVHAFVTIIIVFIVGVIIDIIRIKLFEPLWVKIVNEFCNKFKLE